MAPLHRSGQRMGECDGLRLPVSRWEPSCPSFRWTFNSARMGVSYWLWLLALPRNSCEAFARLRRRALVLDRVNCRIFPGALAGCDNSPLRVLGSRPEWLQAGFPRGRSLLIDRSSGDSI